MSFLPTAFLTFFGDERERERDRRKREGEKGGCSKKATLREREKGEEKKFKKAVERHGMDYTLHIIAFSSSTSICCHSFCIASLDLSLLI
jgi:hypothetical protein